MFDLTAPSQPSAIICDGVSYPIKTDFRVWIWFGENINKMRFSGKQADLSFIFADYGNLPTSADWIDAAIEFYAEQTSSTPHTKTTSREGDLVYDAIYDFVRDSGHLYASFRQVYDINLVTVDHLHWHEFLALFIGLPEGCSMRDIMGWRSYEKSTKDPARVMEDRKRAYTLKNPYATDAIIRQQNEQQAMFPKAF